MHRHPPACTNMAASSRGVQQLPNLYRRGIDLSMCITLLRGRRKHLPSGLSRCPSGQNGGRAAIYTARGMATLTDLVQRSGRSGIRPTPAQPSIHQFRERGEGEICSHSRRPRMCWTGLESVKGSRNRGRC